MDIHDDRLFLLDPMVDITIENETIYIEDLRTGAIVVEPLYPQCDPED